MEEYERNIVGRPSQMSSTMSLTNLLSSPAGGLTNPATSPRASPTATPITISTPSFTDNQSLPDETPSLRSRDLSVDRHVTRSSSPIGRIAEQMPLPASPSESVHPSSSRGASSVSNGSPQSKRQQPQTTPSLGPLPMGDSFSSPSLGQSPSRNPNVGLGVGPVAMAGAGLGVPTTKAERRRSINPAMSFNIDPANSTFAVEPRNSPLPPSPLRASFTDLQKQIGPRSPSSPSPMHVGADGFPFKQSAGGLLSTPKAGDLPPPARTSSLPDQSSALVSPSLDATPSMLPRLSSEQGDQESQTPKIEAPSLRSMNFSLSDPDFALILNQMDRDSAESHDEPKTANSSATVRPDVDDINSESASSSPVNVVSASSSSPSLARSPHMDQLASAVDGEAMATSIPNSRSMSGTRLSPNSAGGLGSTPQLLRTRQPSAESTNSVSSRLGGDSAFSTAVEILAAAKHAGKDSIILDTSLLSGMIGEMEEMKDSINALQNKYSGAKVSYRLSLLHWG